ncbi:hypothetical protein HZH66_001431 [Vespula vulgaris]|uniref:Uncharacterized protein n=1 Tax=Vespula vulgaris TaxID=7454 RepID=A0A834NKM5_VESVU|nr:hypothetical protein HZH66_001431 [Vespula vulgaris]
MGHFRGYLFTEKTMECSSTLITMERITRNDYESIPRRDSDEIVLRSLWQESVSWYTSRFSVATTVREFGRIDVHPNRDIRMHHVMLPKRFPPTLLMDMHAGWKIENSQN